MALPRGLFRRLPSLLSHLLVFSLSAALSSSHSQLQQELRLVEQNQDEGGVNKAFPLEERVLMATRESALWGGRLPHGWARATEGDEESDAAEKLHFKLHLPQCNLDVLEKTANEVSDPENRKRYGKYLTASQVCAIVECPAEGSTAHTGGEERSRRAEAVEAVREWVGEGRDGASSHGDASHVVVEGCDHIALSIPLSMARRLFPETDFAVYQRSGGTSRKEERLVRATGDVKLPQAVQQHVQLLTGLTELLPNTKYGSGGRSSRRVVGARGSAVEAAEEAAADNVSNFTQTLVTPRTIRQLYNIPAHEQGSGWEDDVHGKGGPRLVTSNKQGVVAFDDFYTQSDLCSAYNLLAGDDVWLNSPQVSYSGPGFDAEADEAESDLDTQYITTVAAGVPTAFVNHDESQWILDWAQDASSTLAPDQGGPLVWSISYGFPEEWQCSIAGEGGAGQELCASAARGYDPTVYLDRTNVELMKLAALGTTVIVASGDDGSVGFGATCPLDPTLPVDISGSRLLENACPFEEVEDCRCASFALRLVGAPQNGTSGGNSSTNSSFSDNFSSSSSSDDPEALYTCILPLGLATAQMGVPDVEGGQCAEALSDASCVALLEGMEGMDGLDNNAQGEECRTAFNVSTFSFYSDCACEAVPPVSLGNCTLSGYWWGKGNRSGSAPPPPPQQQQQQQQQQQGGDGKAWGFKSAFTPDFPASSPWVTSVGATQVAWNLQQSCGQASLLRPEEGRQGAETAVNKWTGKYDAGGGFSNYFAARAWQRDEVAAYVQTGKAPPEGSFNASNRGYPDISAVGHNFVVMVEGAVRTVDGTSASAPVVAAMISLLNERRLVDGDPPLGHLNPLLYKMAREDDTVFRKISPQTYDLTGTAVADRLRRDSLTVGDNSCSRFGCCSIGYEGTESGWDAVTGLGVIDYSAFAAYLKLGGGGGGGAGSDGKPSRVREAAYVISVVCLTLLVLMAVLYVVYSIRPKYGGLRPPQRHSDSDGGIVGSGGGGRFGLPRWGARRGGGGDAGPERRGVLTEMIAERGGGAGAGGYGYEEEDEASYQLLEGEGGGGRRGREGRTRGRRGFEGRRR